MELLAITYRSVIYEYTYHALLMILMISGPPIAIASILGLFVAVIQAATQIQEQTFSFAIKMVAVIGTIVMMGGWLANLIVGLANQVFHNFYKYKS
ncbi:MAG: type III secretion system export apparatus subunit SctS [Chlamydiae bacterium]|nr:type III secretion system export apparatus subunit SctS [Chlamydiota bacterium]